jgi:hypothetical protein
MSEQPGTNGLLATASVLVVVGLVTVLFGGVVVGGVVVVGVSLLAVVVDVVGVVSTGSMEMASPEQLALNSTANRKQLFFIGHPPSNGHVWPNLGPNLLSWHQRDRLT